MLLDCAIIMENVPLVLENNMHKNIKKQEYRIVKCTWFMAYSKWYFLADSFIKTPVKEKLLLYIEKQKQEINIFICQKSSNPSLLSAYVLPALNLFNSEYLLVHLHVLTY